MPALVLVVDGSEIARSALARLLDHLGLRAVEASTGDQGLRLLRDGLRPDLLIVDWRLAEMTALDFVERVRRELPERGEIPTLVVGTVLANDDFARVLEQTLRFLRKPFTRQQLVQELDELGIAHR